MVFFFVCERSDRVIIGFLVLSISQKRARIWVFSMSKPIFANSKSDAVTPCRAT